MSTTTMASVHGLVPMAHVADPTRTIAFYRQLGFEVEFTWDFRGQLGGAALRSGEARLMVTLAAAPIDPDEQAVLFYLYTTDVSGLREQLLSEGVEVGEVTFPDYMPAGQIRVSDPDGYCLLIGQAAEQSVRAGASTTGGWYLRAGIYDSDSARASYYDNGSPGSSGLERIRSMDLSTGDIQSPEAPDLA